jgi:hypothetical protein
VNFYRLDSNYILLNTLLTCLLRTVNATQRQTSRLGLTSALNQGFQVSGLVEIFFELFKSFLRASGLNLKHSDKSSLNFGRPTKTSIEDSQLNSKVDNKFSNSAILVVPCCHRLKKRFSIFFIHLDL